MKLSIFTLFLLISIHYLDAQPVTIRLASMEDIPAIISLDSSISYDYFEPLLLQYPEFSDADVTKILTDELAADNVWFISCVGMENNQRLYVAYCDTILVGFIVCHEQDNTIVVIDLVMIDAAYRGKGIAKQLIQQCIQAFPTASTCMLIVLDKNIPACAAYEKMGFTLIDKPLFMQEKYAASRFLCYSHQLTTSI